MTSPAVPPTPPQRVVRRRLRLVGAITLTAIVVVFAAQNLGAGVTVSFLVWEFPASIALVVLAPFLLGLVVGITAIAIRGRMTRQIGGRKTTQRVLGKRDSG